MKFTTFATLVQAKVRDVAQPGSASRSWREGRKQKNMYSVYILYSESLMNYYVGSTENLEKRIKEHNSAKGNYTSKGVPWKLMIKIEKGTRSEAVSLEMKIKKRGIKRYLQDNSLIDFSGRSAAR